MRTAHVCHTVLPPFGAARDVVCTVAARTAVTAVQLGTCVLHPGSNHPLKLRTHTSHVHMHVDVSTEHVIVWGVASRCLVSYAVHF
jgi:hypothetical protein